MIHNTFLIHISMREILASSQYWPIEITQDEVNEFIATRDEIQSSSEGKFSELPLIVGDHKFHASICVDDILLIYVTDIGEDERVIAEKLNQGVKAIRSEILESGIQTTADIYELLIEPSITTKLKIALVGEGGVGKTTTLHLLLGDTPPTQYVPTIALNLETVENIRFGNYSLVIWDFAGQERFRKLWRFYFHGADVIFLVCDSSLRNVIISKDILKLIRRDAPKVPVFAIANKQDKPNVMKPEVVQKILGIATYPMVAIDKDRRDEMLRILMTAAAQYVGVALPDLPATQLLRFTDEATREAVAKIQERVRAKEAEAAGVVAAHAEAARAEAPAKEYASVEIVEEVLVDEEGHLVEASDDYEIIEEIVEIVEEESVSNEEIEVIEELEALEEAFEKQTIADSIEEKVISTGETGPQEEILEEPIEFELPTTSPELSSTSTQDGTGIEVQIEEIAEAEAVPDEMKMAKDLISEALDADEIIAAEIDKVSKNELDIALEAFGSDEVIPIEGETEETGPVDFQAIRELEAILGDLEQRIGVPEDDSLTKETSDGSGLETIEELDDMLDDFEREHETESSEETAESDDSE